MTDSVVVQSNSNVLQTILEQKPVIVLNNGSVTVVRNASGTVTQRTVQTLGQTVTRTQLVTAVEAGPQGPRGFSGGTTFVYDQVTPSALWYIDHGLGLFPAVTVVDSSGSAVYGAVEYVSNTVIEISFAGALAGQAFLN